MLRSTSFVAFALVLAACGDDTAQVCIPAQQTACYDGPEGTESVGACRAGLQTCINHGAGFNECQGQVMPVPEDCGTALDDDCDGLINEDCACASGVSQPCYDGPDATVGVGICRSGQHVCEEDGSGFGPCEGEVLPEVEDCTSDLDDDCDGIVNQASACLCAPGEQQTCYSGPEESEGIGICVSGTQTCIDTGGTFGDCEGAVLPDVEDCSTPFDDDCDGAINEPEASCSCTPGETGDCYSGAAETLGVGDCVAGIQTCVGSGDGYGACEGEVLPVAEDCGTPLDDDCDGEVNETEAGCECTPGDMEQCYTGPEFTAGVGTCMKGQRTCGASGQWQQCIGDITPELEDCNTSLDENCDGAVNEPDSGCDCWFEDVTTLASEDCVLNHGEPLWRKPIAGLPHEMAVDESGFTYMIVRREGPTPGFEAVPDPLNANALVACYQPNGDLLWGRELTGVLFPQAGYGHAYNMSVAPNGLVAFTAPAGNSASTAFGDSEILDWPSTTFRILYLTDPFGFPVFSISVPRSYTGETNTSIHALSVSSIGTVFYANGHDNSHLIAYDWMGEVLWDNELGHDLDDVALAATPDGGVILSFATSDSVNFGTGSLPPIVTGQPDLIVVRFDVNGDAVWAVRPRQATAAFAARVEGGVVAIVEQSSLMRFDLLDGTTISDDPLPGSALPDSSFSPVGVEAVFYSRANSPGESFGVGFVDPYGGLDTGNFLALRTVGGSRWARSPLAHDLVVAGARPDILVTAFEAEEWVDLDGTPVELPQPTVFLARLAY